MGLTAPQLDARSKGIGGSDAAAALGLDPRTSALSLYMQKRMPPGPSSGTGKLETPEMLWGKLLEPVIRQQYAERTGQVVRMPEGTLRHPKYPFILGHVDGVTDRRRLFEAKTARSGENWGEPGSDEIPETYFLQVQHYLILTQLPVADVAVLIGGNDLRMYEVPEDRDIQEMLVDGEVEFWGRVERGEPPEPDWHSAETSNLIARLFPGTSGEILHASADDIEWRKMLDETLEKAKTYQGLADGAKAHMLWGMGEASVLQFPDGYCLRRKKIHRNGYSVDPVDYIEGRFVRGDYGSGSGTAR